MSLISTQSKKEITQEAGRALTRVERIIPWALPIAAFVIYLSFLTRNYYWDGVVFASTIEKAKSLPALFHPNHLFYNVAGLGAYRAAQVLVPAIRPLEVLQIANCASGAFAAALFYRILRQTLGSIYLSASLAILFAFSATWWKFSTDADAYISATLFVLLAFYFALPGKKPHPLLISVLHICALLLHQLTVFFYPVAALALYYQDQSSTRRQRLRRIASYTTATSVATIGIYAYCYHLAFKNLNLKPFLRWITYYTPDIGFTFSPWKDFTSTLAGSMRLFLGGRFNLIQPWLSPFVIGLIVLLALCLILLSIKVLGNWSEFVDVLRSILSLFQIPSPSDLSQQHRKLAWLCIVWSAVYTIFLYCFIPLNAFYRLFYLPALILLSGLAITAARHMPNYKSRGRTALVAACVTLCNFLFVIFPYSHVRPNTPLDLALKMNRIWEPGTEIYYHNLNADDDLLSYFNPSTNWVALDPGKLDRIEARLQQVYATGGQVWLETTALDEIAARQDGIAWLRMHSSGQAAYSLTGHGNDVKLVQIVPAAKSVKPA